MSSPRFFTDEDIYAAIAIGLRKAGFDAISTPESGRISDDDDAQLEYAAADNRAFVTFNVADFAALHTDWIESGRHHAGIIVSQQRPIGDLLRRLLHLAQTLDGYELNDSLRFLSDW